MGIDLKYCFGNICFRVISPQELKEDDRFQAFIADTSLQEDYRIEIYPLDFCEEKKIKIKRPIQVTRYDNSIKVYIKMNLLPEITIANLFSAADIAKILPEKGEFVLHTSYVFYKEKALLFCAPSGTGKSTQAEFWKNARGTVTVNEDRAIIYQKEGVYYAGGCWATGKAKTCRNISAPIHRIVLLEQGSENRIIELSPAEKFKRLIAQCTFDADTEIQRDSIISCVFDLIAAVPVIGYACVNNISSVDELEKYL